MTKGVLPVPPVDRLPTLMTGQVSWRGVLPNQRSRDAAA